MKASIYWFGECRKFYEFVWHEYVIYRRRSRVLSAMRNELLHAGFHVMSDNNTICRIYFVNDDRFKSKINRLLLKTDSNKVSVTENGVFLKREYMYLKWSSFWDYFILPMLIVIAIIWLIADFPIT